jgi:hypothetical protein
MRTAARSKERKVKLGQQDCARVAWDATRSWVRRLHALKVKVLTPKLATQAHTDWQMNAMP